MNRTILSAFIVISFFLTGCSRQEAVENQTAKKTLTIYTSIAPLNFACKQLLGDQDRVIEICPIGEDEPEYIPDEDTLVDMINSDLIVVNGASFENWLKAVSIPETLVHDSALIYKEEWLEYVGLVHSHGGQADHSHTGFNGHTWTAPYYFQKQCTSVYEKIKTLLTPEEQKTRNLDENFKQLMDDLSVLNAKGAEAFSPVKGTTLAASHPTYDYLGFSYGFEILNVDIAPDVEEIDEGVQKQIDLLMQQKEEKGVNLLFWEEEPNEFISKTLSDLGYVHIIYHPLAAMDDLDYIIGMMENFVRVEAAILKAGK